MYLLLWVSKNLKLEECPMNLALHFYYIVGLMINRSFFFFKVSKLIKLVLPCKNLVPTLQTKQLNCQQFCWEFSGVLCQEWLM